MAKWPFTKCVVPVFRGRFPTLFEMKSYKLKDGSMSKPAYSIKAIWTPEKFNAREMALWDTLRNTLDEAAKHEFGYPLNELADHQYRKAIYPGDKDKSPGMGPGTFYASFSAQEMPGVADVHGNPLSPALKNDGGIFDGAFYRASVAVFPYNNAGKGVGFRLLGVKLLGGTRDRDLLTNKGDISDLTGMDDSEWLNASDDMGLD